VQKLRVDRWAARRMRSWSFPTPSWPVTSDHGTAISVQFIPCTRGRMLLQHAARRVFSAADVRAFVACARNLSHFPMHRPIIVEKLISFPQIIACTGFTKSHRLVLEMHDRGRRCHIRRQLWRWFRIYEGAHHFGTLNKHNACYSPYYVTIRKTS